MWGRYKNDKWSKDNFLNFPINGSEFMEGYLSLAMSFVNAKDDIIIYYII